MKVNDNCYRIIFRDVSGTARYEFIVSPTDYPFGTNLRDCATKQLRVEYEEEFVNWCREATAFLGYEGEYYMDVIDLDTGDMCRMSEEAFDSLHDISVVRL